MTRLTCKQALNAYYSVLGESPDGYSEYAACLGHAEAQRFYDSLIERGFKVIAKPIGAPLQ